MGIRESLEQPDEKDLKLQDFVIEEEPERELEFDVEKEITPEIWQRMKDKLEKHKQNKRWLELADFAKDMSILKPDKKDKLKIDEFYQEMLDELRKKPDNFKFLSIGEKNEYRRQQLIHACALAILFPQKRQELMTEKIWQSNKQELMSFANSDAEDSTGRHKLYSFMNGIYNLLNIKPEKKSELSIDPKVWQKFSDILDKNWEKKQWWDYSILAAKMFVFHPERKNELHLDSKTWKEMRQALKKESKGLLNFFTVQAISMMMLSSERVEIDENGLRLIMPEKKSFQQKTSARPERRNF